MKRKIFYVIYFLFSILHSCKDEIKPRLQHEELILININNDVNRICDCFEEGKTNSKKFMECSAENEKVRSKYIPNKKHIDLYDFLLEECQ